MIGPTIIETPCREWHGARNPDGYGNIFRDGRQLNVHRWVWILANGPIAKGLCVCHRCDNPACYRLDHLFLGTHSENMRDMAAKGRMNQPDPRLFQRVTACHRGHEFTPENTYITSRGERNCRACNLEAARRYNARKSVNERKTRP